MSIMTLTERPLGEQIEVLERGLPSSALAEIATALGLPKARIIKALKLVLRTMTEREKKRERFSTAESERLYRIVRPAVSLARSSPRTLQWRSGWALRIGA